MGSAAIWKNLPSEGNSMIWSDFDQLIGAILLIIGALLPVVNPLGDAPIFLRMTPSCDETTHTFLANSTPAILKLVQRSPGIAALYKIQ